MASASRAVYFGSRPEQFPIRLGADRGISNRLPKTRPPGFAVKLVLRRKQRQVTAGTVVDAWCLIVVIFVLEGRLRSFFAQHVVLFRSQESFPFRVGFGHLKHFTSLL